MKDFFWDSKRGRLTVWSYAILLAIALFLTTL
jgi:hypothetical protein